MSNKRFRRENIDVETEEVIDTEVVENTVEPTIGTIGIVSSCDKLNVRETPTTEDDNILCVIALGETVIVDIGESTEDFYKVVCANGVEGFCMKDYITIAGE